MQCSTGRREDVKRTVTAAPVAGARAGERAGPGARARAVFRQPREVVFSQCTCIRIRDRSSVRGSIGGDGVPTACVCCQRSAAGPLRVYGGGGGGGGGGGVSGGGGSGVRLGAGAAATAARPCAGAGARAQTPQPREY
jgi:hypothetical protein